MIDKNQENAWQKASASLDASAKIYAFRVDSVYSETYKLLGGLTRTDALNEEDEDNSENVKKNKKHKNLPNSYVIK